MFYSSTLAVWLDAKRGYLTRAAQARENMMQCRAERLYVSAGMYQWSMMQALRGVRRCNLHLRRHTANGFMQ